MKPILFNTEMVRALLDGRKTVTRRVVKPQPPDSVKSLFPADAAPGADYRSEGEFVWFQYPSPYLPGDILYVRETWCDPTPNQSGYPVLYKADMPMHWDAEDTECGAAVTLQAKDYKWRPSIHMPKEAARIFLRVTGVRVERLRDITPGEAVDEGAVKRPHYVRYGGEECLALHQRYIDEYAALWNSTIKPADRPLYGWEANPWAWVIEFERIDREKALAALAGEGGVS